MLKIGYVRLRDQESATDTTTLKGLGCHVVRAEEPRGAGSADDSAVLYSILDFVSAGDQLVVTRLSDLGGSARAILEILQRLELRGATLWVVEAELGSEGVSGRALRAALEAAASLDPQPTSRRRRPAADEILELQRAGVGPVEIARRLGVSRMTVWRKLKSVAA